MYKYSIIIFSLFIMASCSEAQQDRSEPGIVNKVVAASDYKELLKDEGVVVVDVRTPGEYENGFIPGAINIDFFGDDFESEIDKLDKETKTLVYCKSGNRSGKSAKIMKDLGFKHVIDLEGGYSGWPYK